MCKSGGVSPRNRPAQLARAIGPRSQPVLPTRVCLFVDLGVGLGVGPCRPGDSILVTRGGVAQLGERRVRNAKVGSSILLLSTTIQKTNYSRLVFLPVSPSLQAHLQALGERFEAWYTAYAATREADDKIWGELRREFASVGSPLPEYAAMLPKGLLNVLYSTKHGRVVGWDYSNFIQIAHHVEPGLREYLHYFRGVLKAYGRADLIRREDQSGKWVPKVAEYKARIRTGDSAYAPDNTHDDLVRILFAAVMSEQPT